MPVANPSKDIYTHVRREALLGNLGEKPTSEGVIARQFGVSRSIARQAFLKLRKEGILESRKRFGTYVKEHSIEEMLEYFNLRMGLEIVAVRQMAKSATADQLEILRALAQKCEEMCKQMDQSISNNQNQHQRRLIEIDLIDSDRRLHLALVTLSGNKMLAEAYEQFNIHPIASTEISNTDYHCEASRIVGEHNQLVDAIERRDADEAEKTIRNHLGRSIDFLELQLLNKKMNKINGISERL